MSYRIKGACRRQADPKMLVNPYNVSRICTAAGGLADHRDAFQRFEVVGECFGRRKGPLACQNIHILSDVSLARNKRQSPKLSRPIALAVKDIAKMNRFT